MENRVGKSGGAEISKKTRSLDIQSLYKSTVSKEGHNKGKCDADNDDEVRKKKRKSKKELSLTTFEPLGKKRRKILDGVHVDGGNLGLGYCDQSQSGLSQELNGNNGLNSISSSLDENGNVIRIPRRPRGSLGRKKFESNQVSKPSGRSSFIDRIAKLNGDCKKLEGNQVSNKLGSTDSKASSVDKIAKLNSDSAGKVVGHRVKQKTGSEDLKESRTGTACSARHAKEEDGHSVVNIGDTSSRKRRRNHRKRKDLALGSEVVAKKVDLSVDKSASICDDFLDDDDDEENLERNAARMLSSRFDPSCTGFSSKSRSASSSANGLSYLRPSGRDFVGGLLKTSSGPESPFADTANRVLRPRKQHKEKGLSRKRRHFYEILSGDLDAYSVLNRRIKVFWPLDECWYYGLVNDYDPERNLHHIKYDDRDEEWINLQNERFKLLLLPNEIPGKAEPKKSDMLDVPTDGGKRDLTPDDDSCTGSYMDSEPIISWLARSSRRVKSSLTGALRKQEPSNLSPIFVPPLLSVKTDDAHCDVVFLERDSTSHYNSALSDKLADAERGEKSVSESIPSSKDSKLPIVYVRKRFQKKDEGLCSVHSNGNVCGCAPGSVTSLSSIVDSFTIPKEHKISLSHSDPDELLWSIDDDSLLKLNMSRIESKQIRFELCLPLPPLLEYTSRSENFWLLRAVLMLQYGTIVNIWPNVHLEMLFIDNIVGLRSLLFEGCLKQAVAFVFLVLTVFHQSSKGKYVDLQLPVTSIGFKFSRVKDLRKQLVFAFQSFSRVKYSKWLYLDRKLQRHCLLAKELPLAECSYDNIKALEGGSNHLHKSFGGEFSFEDSRKKSLHGIMIKGVSREFCNVNLSHSSAGSDVKQRKLPPFSLSFTAAPTFFLSLHLKLLLERSIASISLQDHDSVFSVDQSENTYASTADDYTQAADCSENASELISDGNEETSLTKAACAEWLPCAKPQLGTDAVTMNEDGSHIKSSQSLQSGNLDIVGTPACSKVPGNNPFDVIVRSQKWEFSDIGSERFATLPGPLVPKDHSYPGLSNSRHYSGLDGLSVEIPSFDQVEKPIDGRTPNTLQASDLAWNLSPDIIRSPNTPGPRSLWHHNRSASGSSSFGELSHVWPDGKSNPLSNGFGNGPKKPRTQVQYTWPFGGFTFGSKDKIQNQTGLPYKRIRRANERRTPDVSRSSRKNLELLACDANVLITLADKGWRECGARVVLELADQNEWKLGVKIYGTTKYSYKVHHVLQPGSTNRYTHAMMWKGGKDWVLEFPDRGQWNLFKEMHEECYNRNIRAASVKNIPIPGVRLIEESDDNVTEVPFFRSSPKYFRQVETDTDMAMNSSHILYDMDSDDEQWVLNCQKSSFVHESKCEEISEELFEKTMDMFEKVAYAQQRDHFTPDEIEEFMVEVGPMEVIKLMYEHWRQKRQRKGMPLIRQLQPPLWERYRQQMRMWEQAISKANTALFGGCLEKARPMEKPPMFAFCMKPRGLEVPNKGSKQRSQKKFPVSGHSHTVLADQDGLHVFGRRLNGFAFVDEKVIVPPNNHESSDGSLLLQASTRAYSPRDAGYFSLSSDGSEWNHHPKLYRNKSKKIGTFIPSNNPRMVASYNQRMIGKRNGVHRGDMVLPEWPSQKHYQSEGYYRHGIEQLEGLDSHEFSLRDASSAAQHAVNMAKLKREKAQRLLSRADVAIHKAVVALMTAEAIKASFEESNGNG